jgi:glycosyltransferase involved in cell wall biosynthesis
LAGTILSQVFAARSGWRTIASINLIGDARNEHSCVHPAIRACAESTSRHIARMRAGGLAQSAAANLRPDVAQELSCKEATGAAPILSPVRVGQSSYGIIIPVFNEAASLPQLWREISQTISSLSGKWELIFVNDGSRDDSAATLDRIAQQDPRVKVIHLRRNFGQTAALMAGLDATSSDIILALDADLQNDPSDIPVLLGKIGEGYDVVSGWRKDRQDSLVSRVLISRIANKLISWMSGIHLHDHGCTLKAYRRELIKGVRLYGEMHRFIPIYAFWQGARICEIPVNHRPRIHGRSNYGLERIIKVVLDLVVVKFLHEYSLKPMYIFGGFGLISFGIGFLAGLVALYYKVTGQIDFIQTPLPLLFVMCSITGAVCALLGLLAELVIRTYYESQDKRTYAILRKTGFDASNAT